MFINHFTSILLMKFWDVTPLNLGLMAANKYSVFISMSICVGLLNYNRPKSRLRVASFC